MSYLGVLVFIKIIYQNIYTLGRQLLSLFLCISVCLSVCIRLSSLSLSCFLFLSLPLSLGLFPSVFLSPCLCPYPCPLSSVLHVCLCLCLCLCICIHVQFVHVCLCLCLSFCLLLALSLFLSSVLSLCLCLYFCRSVSVFLSLLWLYVCLSVCLSYCLYLSPSLQSAFLSRSFCYCPFDDEIFKKILKWSSVSSFHSSQALEVCISRHNWSVLGSWTPLMRRFFKWCLIKYHIIIEILFHTRIGLQCNSKQYPAINRMWFCQPYKVHTSSYKVHTKFMQEIFAQRSPEVLLNPRLLSYQILDSFQYATVPQIDQLIETIEHRST